MLHHQHLAAALLARGQASIMYVVCAMLCVLRSQVYQRQMMKADLADATMQGGGGVNRLSHDELKQLFHLDQGPECSTRKLLESSKAGSHVLWLQLGEGGSSGSSSAGLPPPLAAAVAAGVVTAVNRENKQLAVEEAGEMAEAVGEVAEAAGQAGIAAEGAGRCDDVSALEVEDW
jgi:DNA repair and recombination protein RAD54B